MKTTNNIEVIPAIQRLYIDAFTKGASAQHVDPKELQLYLTEILKIGFALVNMEDEILKACLLFTPLTYDRLCPVEISNQFEVKNCLYIAEVMVAEAWRGKGLGKKLMEAFFEIVDKNKYDTAILRVWEENLPALNLYRSMGFEVCASMEQPKKMPDGKTDFLMKKLYLYKLLN